MIENKCLPLVYILTGDKKGDTYSYVLSVIKYFFDQNCPTDTGTAVKSSVEQDIEGYILYRGSDRYINQEFYS